MEAQELRIGNLAFIDNEKYHPKLKNIPLEVTAITPNLDSSGWTYSISLKHINQKQNVYYETYSQFIKWVKPITLNEKWLLKFGWSYYNGKTTGVLTKDTSCKLDLDFYKNKIQIKSHYEGYEFYRDLKIKYIHQLQNLYFTLTGTELTIKE